MKQETWKKIRGFPDYAASNLGRVKRIRNTRGAKSGSVLKGSPNGGGYLSVGLRRNGQSFSRRIHCLVAEAFIGPRPEGLYINHKDGDKQNNDVSNLEYVTPGENVIHALDLGLRKKGKVLREPLPCEWCDKEIRLRHHNQRFCDLKCKRSYEGKIMKLGKWALNLLRTASGLPHAAPDEVFAGIPGVSLEEVKKVARKEINERLGFNDTGSRS